VALLHRSAKSNDVRAPAVDRGEAVIVTRYSEDSPKVALVNPDDLAMLEEAYDLLAAAGELDPLAVDDLTLKTLQIEERPDTSSIEDPAQIAALLDL
jgi:hypothetical protein